MNSEGKSPDKANRFSHLSKPKENSGPDTGHGPHCKRKKQKLADRTRDSHNQNPVQGSSQGQGYSKGAYNHAVSSGVTSASTKATNKNIGGSNSSSIVKYIPKHFVPVASPLIRRLNYKPSFGMQVDQKRRNNALLMQKFKSSRSHRINNHHNCGRKNIEDCNRHKHSSSKGAAADSISSHHRRCQRQGQTHRYVPAILPDENVPKLQKLIDERLGLLTALQASQGELNKEIIANLKAHSKDIAEVAKESLTQTKDIRNLEDKMLQVQFNQKQQIKYLISVIKMKTQKERKVEPSVSEENMELVEGHGQGEHEGYSDEESTDDNIDSSDDSEDDQGDEEEVDEELQKELLKRQIFPPIKMSTAFAYFGMQLSHRENEPDGEKQLMAIQESSSPREVVKMALLQKKIDSLNETLTGHKISSVGHETTSDHLSESIGYSLLNAMPPVHERSAEVAQIVAAIQHDETLFRPGKLSCLPHRNSYPKDSLNRCVQMQLKNFLMLKTGTETETSGTTASRGIVANISDNLLKPKALTETEQRGVKRKICGNSCIIPCSELQRRSLFRNKSLGMETNHLNLIKNAI